MLRLRREGALLRLGGRSGAVRDRIERDEEARGSGGARGKRGPSRSREAGVRCHFRIAGEPGRLRRVLNFVWEGMWLD